MCDEVLEVIPGWLKVCPYTESMMARGLRTRMRWYSDAELEYESRKMDDEERAMFNTKCVNIC